jgi:DNA-binding CsgD family transcriptional regulator
MASSKSENVLGSWTALPIFVGGVHSLGDPAHMCGAERGFSSTCSVCTSLAACHLLGVGLLFCDRECRVLGANRLALSILEAGDILRVRADGVLGTTANHDPTVDALLRRMVVRALDGQKTTAIIVPRSGNASSLTLIVRETFSGSETGLEGPSWALVQIIDPAQSVLTGTVDFQTTYRLSAPEALLAELLAGGFSLEKCCDELAISSSKGRDHLRALFRKTGVRRLHHLVALLRQELNADQRSGPVEGFVEPVTALERPH